jgi:hypothetical protein
MNNVQVAEVGIKGRGAPLKLNDTMIDALAELVAAGNYLVTAAQVCKIDYTSLNRWLNIAQDDLNAGNETVFTKLYYALKAAEARAEADFVAVVKEAAQVKREWLPAMTFLERRHPERWGRRDRLQVDQHTTQEIVVSQVEVVKDYGPGALNTRQPAGLIDTTTEDAGTK